MKMKCAIMVFMAISHATEIRAGLLISEFVTGTGSDWVEIFFDSAGKEKIDVSPLYVTAYYGANERLGTEPITLSSYDRPETPWDDRFAVVHLRAPGMEDETDRTGDGNHNGRIDIYCNNYSGSLWNTEGVIAIDTDDDPANGGIIDFVAYSNRDGSPGETVLMYVDHARTGGQWAPCPGEDPQLCAVDIGPDGLKSFMGVSRKSSPDTNSWDDFAVTNFQTPGRPNIFSAHRGNGRIFHAAKKRITMLPGYERSGRGNISLTVFESCHVKLRVFTSTGVMVYESPLYRSVPPGLFTLQWNPAGGRSRLHTALYLAHIEATAPALRRSQSEKIVIICSRYR